MKDPAIARTIGEAFPQHLFRRSVLTGSLSHFRGPFVGAAFHFLRSHVFDVLRKAPLVAKRIGDFPVAVSPELIHERRVYLGAGGNGSVEGGIHILRVHENIDWDCGPWPL